MHFIFFHKSAFHNYIPESLFKGLKHERYMKLKTFTQSDSLRHFTSSPARPLQDLDIFPYYPHHCPLLLKKISTSNKFYSSIASVSFNINNLLSDIRVLYEELKTIIHMSYKFGHAFKTHWVQVQLTN